MATQKETAAHLDLSTRWISELVKSGVLPNGRGRGGYNLDDCRLAYIRYLRGVSTGQVTDIEPSDNEDYSKLFEKEKHREKKRQNDIEEKIVAPVSLLTDALLKASNQIVPILESLPLIMKRNWPEITGDQILLVKKAIAECRNAVADMEIDIDY